MREITKKVFISFLAIYMSSCATIFTGTKSAIQFNSKPSGATVYMDGAEIGTTPMTFQVKKSSDAMFSFEKDGYNKRTVSLQKSFNAVSIINLGCILCWIIDVATGAMKKFDQKGINATLKEN
tara:strand:+ start:33 stop:401 length:369 start_codon:yes stop_codon:yes gene_type:complete